MTFCSRAGSDSIAVRMRSFGLGLLVGGIRLFRLGGNQRGRQRRLVEVLAARERRRRLDGVDADDRAAEPLFVGAHLRGKLRKRRLAAELAAQLLARRLELAALAAHATRPGVLAQRVDHGAADAPLGKGLELDPARFVEAVRGVNQPDDAVLDEVADVDRVGHGRRHSSGKLLDERKTGNDAGIFFAGSGTARAHDVSSGPP